MSNNPQFKTKSPFLLYLATFSVCIFVFVFFAQTIGFADNSATQVPSKEKSVQLIQGWSYTKGFVRASAADQTNWIPLADVADTDIPIETGEISLYTYRITLPNIDCQSCHFSMYHYTRVFDIYLGDQLLYTHSGGQTSTTLELARPPLLIDIPYTKENNQLFIVTNHHERSFPLNQPIYYGEPDHIISYYLKTEQLSLGIGAFILLVGLISFMLYLSLSRDRSFLFLGLCAFQIGIYFFSGTSIISFNIDLPRFWGFSEYFFVYSLPITAWLYFRYFVPKNRWIDLLMIAPNLIFCIFVLIAMYFDVSIYNFSNEHRYLFVVTLLIGLIAMIRSARKGNRDAKYVVISFALVCLITMIDAILKSIYYNPFNLGPFVGAVFMASQLFVLTFRFRRMNEELKSRSENLRLTNERLVEMNQIKDSIISNTSHELRTPLHGIIGLAESMIDVPNPSKFNYNKNLQLIASSGRRLQKLIEDILDFSNVRNRNIELMKTPVTLTECVDAVIELLKPNIAYRPIEIVNLIPSNFPAILADPNRLQQMLSHLIGNAMKFTEVGSIKIDATHDDHFAEIHIHDTGIGIDPSQMSRIFELFEQGDLRTERMYGGTGLGLALTKELAEAHQGQITCTSKVGKGSTFTLRLPLAKKTA